jgi:hypothetical protein
MLASPVQSISCARFCKNKGGDFQQSKKTPENGKPSGVYILDRDSGSLALDKSFFQHLLVAEPQIRDIG